MRFVIFILITYILFQGANSLLGEQRNFFVDDVFYIVFVPDRNSEETAAVIDFDDLNQYVSRYPDYGFIPAQRSGTIIDNRNGVYHRAEYRIDEINSDYSSAEVTYYVKNNKTYSSYLIENGKIRPLYKRTPRNKLIVAYAVIFVFLSLSLTMIFVYFLEPRYRKYLKITDRKFGLYLTQNRQVRFFIRGVLFFYLIPVSYFLYQITNNLRNLTDLILVGIVSALAVDLAIAVFSLDVRAVKSLFILVLMILLFPGTVTV